MATDFRDLYALAGNQDGQFAVRQAADLGVGELALRAAVGRGGLARFAVAPGAPDADMAALLRCGPQAVLSHASAARRHGLLRIAAPQRPVVTMPHGIRRRWPDLDVRSSRRLEAADITVVDGLRCTSVARTVCDLADRSDPWGSLALLDDAVAAGAAPAWVHQRAAALLQGRPALRLVAEATDPEGAAAFRSVIERFSRTVYAAGGLPEPDWNVEVTDARGRIGVVDALWRRWSVIAEVEGLRFHTAPDARRADAKRFNRLSDQHTVRRFGYLDLVQDPVEVVSTLHRALRARGCELDPTRIPSRIEVPPLFRLRLPVSRGGGSGRGW
jgi:hypothetical protein